MHNTDIKKTHNIIFSGGGTGGSVTPLLALAEELKSKSDKYGLFWIGTMNGIEREMVERENIKYYPIYSGKLRRYFSLKNLTDIVRIFLGFLQSLAILWKLKPELVVSAGAYVSVGVAWAAWLLRIPIMIHQMDFVPGLANKLISPLAKRITVTFEKSLMDYPDKAVWTGNPIRKNFKFQASDLSFNGKFGLKESIPVIFILGGGTGSMAINKLIAEGIGELAEFCQVIHVTGKNKGIEEIKIKENYHCAEFFNVEEMAFAYQKADVVVSRCGMGTLTELSYFGKPSILIPLPATHQESNARIFVEKKAAIVLDQDSMDKDRLVKEIRSLLANDGLRKELSENIKKVFKADPNRNVLEVIDKLLE